MLDFKVIVVPTDLSEYSLRAVPYAIGLAERFDARLKVVCVNEPTTHVADVAWVSVDDRALEGEHADTLRRSIQKLILDHMPEDVTADAEILNGNAVDKLIEYARDVNADLIVMATHGRGGIAHMVMGSTAEAVVRKAPCPVLTLKQPMTVAAEAQN